MFFRGVPCDRKRSLTQEKQAEDDRASSSSRPARPGVSYAEVSSDDEEGSVSFASPPPRSQRAGTISAQREDNRRTLRATKKELEEATAKVAVLEEAVGKHRDAKNSHASKARAFEKQAAYHKKQHTSAMRKLDKMECTTSSDSGSDTASAPQRGKGKQRSTKPLSASERNVAVATMSAASRSRWRRPTWG